MVSRIFISTPVRVWGLLVALVWLGFSQTRARSVGMGRILILPIVMTGLSLSGTISSFGANPAVLAPWLLVTGLIVWLTGRRLPPESLERHRLLTPALARREKGQRA